MVNYGVYRETDTGREKDRSHPLYELINLRASRHQSAYFFRKTLLVHRYLCGHGLAEIIRDAKTNRPSEFRLIKPGDYSILEGADGSLLFDLHNGRVLAEEDVLHLRHLSLNGTDSPGLLGYQKPHIQLELTANEYLSRYYQKGTMQPGYLKTDANVAQNKEAFQKLQEGWDSHRGAVGDGKTPLLGLGTDFKPITSTNRESQTVEFLEAHRGKFYTLFRVPPHLVGDTSKATSFGGGIEQLSIQFVTYTLLPLAVSIEQEIDYKCFRKSERGTYYTKHNFNNLMRGDFAGRMEGYAKGVQAGVFKPNEARAFEDMNADPHGDALIVNGNIITLENAKNNIPAGAPKPTQAP